MKRTYRKTIRTNGFTLIELMIVITIIGILSTMALPSYQDRVIRAQVTEALHIAEFAKTTISEYYRKTGRLPGNNSDAGLPEPEKIVGNYLAGLTVSLGGSIDLTLGNRGNKNIIGKIITIRPAVVKGYPQVPISWVSGHASVPQGMTVNGKNNTTLAIRHTPMAHRY